MEWSLALFVELVVAVLLLLLFRLRRPRKHKEMADHFPGLPTLPFLGNAHQLGKTSNDLYNILQSLTKQFYGSPYKLWIGSNLYIVLARPKDMEIVLGSNKHIEKADSYLMIHPWLGTGLLTSTGSKWHRHRKILTPTFHFKILEEFIEVFNTNAEIFVSVLQEKAGESPINILHYVALNTLDNICETAMGLQINAMRDEESEYVKAVRWESDCVMKRMTKPWLQNELVFAMSGMKGKHLQSLKILHQTTESVIKARRVLLQEEGGTEKGKRRLAFLDLLIESTFNGSGLTDENIREEVDTFMFEGHDTTAAAISFTLWLLSWHPDIQEAAAQEVLEVWPDNIEPLSYHKLQELKLLERIIKEALRLYPSVPFIGRVLREDVRLSGGLIAPKDSSVLLLTYMAHRDPEVFPDPEKFDPDRFLPENANGRHPFAYTPFSAGPRNCIGQKFAMLEMKSTLAHLLREFKFSPGATSQEQRLSPELILTVKEGIPVIVGSRQAHTS